MVEVAYYSPYAFHVKIHYNNLTRNKIMIYIAIMKNNKN